MYAETITKLITKKIEMKTSFGNSLSNTHTEKNGYRRPIVEVFREHGTFLSVRSLISVCFFVHALLWQPRSVAFCVLPSIF
jgi:hypothetical protein